MKENNDLPLQAISPIIEYDDFYSNYHKRKKPVLLLKELPQIKKESFKNFKTINNNKSDKIINLPALNTSKSNSTCFPKLNGVQYSLKNIKLQLKNKISKNKGSLSIKYINIINMNIYNKLLNYELYQPSQFYAEIIKYIHNPIDKKKFLNELNKIEKNTNEEIDNIMNNTTKKEKEEALYFFKANPKIIDLCAEEIFKEFNENKNINITNNSIDKIKEKKIHKNKEKEDRGSKMVSKNKHFPDFLSCAKNNIRKKIELRNEYNQEISIEYIELLLQHEIEKIKIIMEIYMKEKQNEEILFNPDEHSSKSEDLREKIKKEKNMKALDKSIKRLIRINKYYNSLIKTNKEEGSYLNDKIMINENTQYNYEELLQEKNNENNSERDYISNYLKTLENKNIDQINNKYNMKFNDENKFGDYPDNKNIFYQFKKFSRNEKSNINDPNSKQYLEKNDMENNIERNTIDSYMKNEDNQKEFWNEKNNIKLSNSQSYKIIKEKGKIISMKNKDILSLLDKTKYKNNDNIKKMIKGKDNENIYLINNKMNNKLYSTIEKNKNENIKNEVNITENHYNENTNNDVNIIKTDNKAEDDNQSNYNSNYNYISDERNNYLEENEDNEEFEDYNSSENEDEDKTNEDYIKSPFPAKDNDDDNNNNNQENNNNNIESSSTEEQNRITSRNMLSTQSNQNESEKENIDKPEKKSKSKNKKKKGNKLSPDKIKQLKEISNSKYELTKSKERKKRNILINNNIIFQNKPQNNRIKIKNVNNFKKAKTTKKDIILKRGRKSIFSNENRKKFTIKDFETLEEEDEKKIKRNLSHHNISRLENAEMNLKGEVNVIKLHEEDVEQILNYINEEEKRRIRIKEKEEKIMEEKKRKSKSNLYSLFKVKIKKDEKKEEKKYEDLTKEDLIEKLKKEDFRIRQYIEDIIKAGLTLGDKEINKRMKNKSVIVFQGSNLGTFRFKKNFGIKEEVDIEPFRPLSQDKRTKEKDSDNKETETEKIIFNKEKREKNIGNKKEEKERQRLKKMEEARKKLIYDNRYLYEKKKPSIKFILRKEIEEILQGGIFLQKLTKTEEEKNLALMKRFLPKRRKFVKKKKYRAKLFRKSHFLNEVINTEPIEPIKENNDSSSESEIKEESDHSFENKMQTFIERIKKLKKGEKLNLNEIERILNQKNERDEREKDKEIRMQGFMNTLNDYRDMNKNIRMKNDNFSYKVPLLISSNSKNDKFERIIDSNL